ncbi:MAG: ATPase, T2SS/T4P/T4SS family [Planctomycetota bacterium]
MSAVFQRTIEHYLAPVLRYLRDPAVAEVMINRFDEVFIEKSGKMHRVSAAFPDAEAYEAAINNVLQFTGRSLSDRDMLVDARLPDGSRVHVAKSPCSRLGMAVTIRRFSPMMLDVDWLVELGTLTQPAKEYLALAVRGEQNVLVAGGTSSGKTSLLNALSAFIPKGERIVTIEDSAELQLQQDHMISLEAKAADRMGQGAVGIRELFRSSLRLRPDRIIIGEVRGGEALDMIQAMTSGHGGSMGTLHANSTLDALNRLETMALMSKVELPLNALRSQIASAIDLVVHLSRQIGGQRVVTQISEVLPPDAQGQYVLRDIFRLEPETEGSRSMTLQPTGLTTALVGLPRLKRPEKLHPVTQRVLGLQPAPDAPASSDTQPDGNPPASAPPQPPPG